MAYDPGAIDAALVAAVGDEPGLIGELRGAFLDSARRSLALIETASDEQGWRTNARRLKGLAASFGATRLMAVAAEAADGECGDAAMLHRLRRIVARL